MKVMRLVLGWVMIALGVFVALHPLWSHGRPVTTSIWLDMAFAAVFLLRGIMNLRVGSRARSA
jgi:uncharacterized membrane protein HdeD (DUF308 family)